MKTKIINAIKDIFEDEEDVLDHNKKLKKLKHFGLEVFFQNPKFQEVMKTAVDIKPTGKFKTHNNGQEVIAKTGEIKFENGDKSFITSFVFDNKFSGDIDSRYIELRDRNKVIGIGSVWDIEDEKKYVFLYENKTDTQLIEDVVTVIDNPSPTFLQADFYYANGKWCGECIGQIHMHKQKPKYHYKFLLDGKLLGVPENCYAQIDDVKLSKQLKYPLLSAKKLYAQKPALFKIVPESALPHTRHMLEKSSHTDFASEK